MLCISASIGLLISRHYAVLDDVLQDMDHCKSEIMRS